MWRDTEREHAKIVTFSRSIASNVVLKSLTYCGTYFTLGSGAVASFKPTRLAGVHVVEPVILGAWPSSRENL